MPCSESGSSKVNRVQTYNSPSINAFYKHHPVSIICDSGATASLVSLAFATRCNIPIKKTMHGTSQADGKSKMSPCGETHITLSRGHCCFELEAIIVRELDCDILAGMPFLIDNNMVIDFPKETIVIDGQLNSFNAATTPIHRQDG